MQRKQFDKLFLHFNQSGKQIWVVTKVKDLPQEIVQIATNLASLDFIRYIRICDESITASSENYPNRPKIPVTRMHHPTAIGIELLYSKRYKTLDFSEINSPTKGNGSKMVEAVLDKLPNAWYPIVLMDWSGGFGEKMIKKISSYRIDLARNTFSRSCFSALIVYSPVNKCLCEKSQPLRKLLLKFNIPLGFNSIFFLEKLISNKALRKSF